MRVIGVVKTYVNGKLIDESHNEMTDAGLQKLAALVGGTSTDKPGYIAFGTQGASYPSQDPSRTALDNEIDRQSASITVSGNTVKYTATHTASGDEAIAEVGLFDAASGGTMWALKVYLDGNGNAAPRNLSANDTLTVEWTLTFNRG